MAEPEKDTSKLELPGGAPQTLKDFVACKTDKVDIDLSGDFSWLAPFFGTQHAKVPPKVTYEPTKGKTNEGTLTIDWQIDYTKPIKLGIKIENGELKIDAPKGRDKTIEDFATKLNDHLKSAETPKCLGDITYDDKKRELTLTKKDAPSEVGSAAGALGETWRETLVVTNNSDQAITAAASGALIGIGSDVESRTPNDAIAKIVAELRPESTTRFSIGYQTESGAQPASQDVDERLAAPRAEKSSQSLITRPSTFQYNSPEPTGYRLAIRAETEGVYIDRVVATSEWVEGIVPAGERTVSPALRFDFQHDEPWPGDPQEVLPISFGIPTAAALDIQARRSDIGPITYSLVTDSSSGLPAPWELAGWEVDDSSGTAYPYFNPELRIDVSSDPRGCLRYALMLGIPSVIVAVIVAILALSGGNGDDALIEVGPTASIADDAINADLAAVEGLADDAPTDDAQTLQIFEGFIDVVIFPFEAVGGRNFDADGIPLGPNDATMNGLIVRPSDAVGLSPALVLVPDWPLIGLDRLAIEIFQEGDPRQGCANTTRAGIFTSGTITNVFGNDSGAACGLNFDAMRTAFTYLYVENQDGTISDFLYQYMPGHPSLTGRIDFEGAGDDFTATVNEATRPELFSIPMDVLFGGGGSLVDFLGEPFGGASTSDENVHIIDLTTMGVCGNNFGFDNEEILAPTPPTQFDSASIQIDSAGTAYIVTFPTRYYLDEGMRWDEINTEEGNFSGMQFRVYIGPMEMAEWGARFNFSRILQPGEERLTFFEVESGFENNPPQGVFGQPPELLVDAFGFRVGPLTVIDDWIVHRLEFARFVAPAGGISTECVGGFDLTADPALDAIVGGLVDGDEMPDSVLINIQINY